LIDRRYIVSAATAFGLSVALLPIASHSQKFAVPSPLAAFDKNKDGTVDLSEAKQRATTVFDKIEKDNDTTLDAKEVGGRLSKDELKEADPDNDGTLTKDEYLALVEKRFDAADPDKDGTLDGKELNSTAGRSLLRLIR
jgi:hypothetical protein